MATNYVEFKDPIDVTKVLGYGKFSSESITSLTYKGKTERVLDLISRGVDPNFQAFTNGETVLHIASKLNNIGLVKELVKNRKVNLNMTDINGLTALRHAHSVGNYDIITILLDAGADPKVGNKSSGYNPKKYDKDLNNYNRYEINMDEIRSPKRDISGYVPYVENDFTNSNLLLEIVPGELEPFNIREYSPDDYFTTRKKIPERAVSDSCCYAAKCNIL